MFIWGGFQLLFSGGNPEKIQKGKDTLVWATLGLVIIFGSWAITSWIIKGITTAAGNP